MMPRRRLLNVMRDATGNVFVFGILILMSHYIADYMEEAGKGRKDWFDCFLIDLPDDILRHTQDSEAKSSTSIQRYIQDSEATSSISRWSQSLSATLEQKKEEEIKEMAKKKLQESKSLESRGELLIKRIEIILMSQLLTGMAFLDGWESKSKDIKNFLKQHYVHGRSFENLISRSVIKGRKDPFLKTVYRLDILSDTPKNTKIFRSFHCFMEQIQCESYYFGEEEFERLWKLREIIWLKRAERDIPQSHTERSSLIVSRIQKENILESPTSLGSSSPMDLDLPIT